MIFIITILLLACDFYYLKNIAGRRLVGLRWWNEVDPSTGDSQWVFESLEPGTRQINSTDSRFFWLALYIQPLWWILMAILAIIRLQFLWLPLVGELRPFSLFLFLVCFFFHRYTYVVSSYRVGSHHHQYSGVLSMRQVQPSEQFRGRRLRIDKPGNKPCEQFCQPHVQVVNQRKTFYVCESGILVFDW